jgi:hypothetical protein
VTLSFHPGKDKTLLPFTIGIGNLIVGDFISNGRLLFGVAGQTQTAWDKASPDWLDVEEDAPLHPTAVNKKTKQITLLQNVMNLFKVAQLDIFELCLPCEVIFTSKPRKGTH